MADASPTGAPQVQRTLEEYRRIAFGDMRSVMDWDSSGLTLKDSMDLTDDEAVMVAEVFEITTQTGVTIKIKLHDKLRALEGIRKMLDFDAPAKMKPEGPGRGPIPVITMAELAILAQRADPEKVRALWGQLVDETEATQ